MPLQPSAALMGYPSCQRSSNKVILTAKEKSKQCKAHCYLSLCQIVGTSQLLLVHTLSDSAAKSHDQITGFVRSCTDLE